LVIETSLYYDARSEKHQTTCYLVIFLLHVSAQEGHLQREFNYNSPRRWPSWAETCRRKI